MPSLLISFIDMNMVPTTCPLLWNLMRLCVYQINPIHDVTVCISFDWRCDNDDDDSVDNINRNELVVVGGSNGILNLILMFLSVPGGVGVLVPETVPETET